MSTETGVKNEVDAFDKIVTIFGKVLERGLNTVNMPWCDNSSDGRWDWSSGWITMAGSKN
jgi:hypothetical protein